MEMVLPRNYVEIDQEEMMYLDGGVTARVRTAVYGAIGFVIGKIVNDAVSASLVGAAMKSASAWLKEAIDTVIIAAYVKPWLAVGTVVAGARAGVLVYRHGRSKGFW